MPGENSIIRAIVARNNQKPEIVAAFAKFRKDLFVDTFGWQLPTVNDCELDEFYTPNAEYSVIVCDDQVIGGFRAIRTDYDYLAFKTFPQLACLKDYPRRRDVWEISRFGVWPEATLHHLAQLNYSLMFRFAKNRGASALVAVAEPIHERYLRLLGIRTRRYGPSQKIGVDLEGRDLVCVAGEIPIADQAPERLAELLQLSAHLEIDDAMVQRPEAIPA